MSTEGNENKDLKEILKSMPCTTTSKDSDCLNMIYIMREIGVGEDEIKQAVLDFWKGAVK